MITDSKNLAGIRQLLSRRAPAAPAAGAARPRRLRQTPALRAMVRETRLAPDDFIYPLFVRHGQGQQTPIASMPGVFQWSPDLLAREAESIAGLGIPAVLLFGLPDEKDAMLNIPGAGLTLAEQLGLSDKSERISGRGSINPVSR